MIRSEHIRDLLIGFVFLAVQVILFRHLQIYGAETDLILIYLLWICTKKNRTEALLYAALFGFLQDAMTDLWGLHTFTKTLLIFISHNYLNKVSENRFILWQIFLILLAAAFLHNMIMILLGSFLELYSSSIIAWSMLTIGSVYTAIIGSFLYLVRTE